MTVYIVFPYQFKHGVLPISMLEQKSGSKIKIKKTINSDNEHKMFGNEVRSILLTSATVKQLQFLIILLEND